MEELEENNGIKDRWEEVDAPSGDFHKTLQLSGMYQTWFIDYASYVILERAVPAIEDGLKPVQRRLFHAMKELDDGRYNKVANIIGHTMKYHPHGDASIGEALVQLGQKELMIDTQGNWGNILTGDSAAAPRYIEARLSKLALEVLFNPKTTTWKLSYDGRNTEPVALPVKFPLLLNQGAEGIAVGLASKILPHNFLELIDGSIAILKGEPVEILPDFPTGGLADFSRYNDGLRGGKVRVRARINKTDKKTLVITEIPFGVTTNSLIDSIIAANEKGKIKIRKIDDNTAQNVEILIHLAAGVSPDTTIDALYAFTDCEVTISPNNCVIAESRPEFMGTNEILAYSTRRTLDLLRLELEIRKSELEEQWHFGSLEKIFIEERIYRDIEECETWESVIGTIDKGLRPFRKKLLRDVTREDIIRLTEIRIKRISRYDSFKADEMLKNISEEIEKTKYNLDHLVDYAIHYYEEIRRKYGKGRGRKTEIRSFESIQATMVAAPTQKLYVNRAEGFAGTGLRKDEYVCDCSDIDDIIVFRNDGTFVVTKVADKAFVGKDVAHIDVFKKNDDRTIYNVVYQDGRNGKAMVKRFPVTAVNRDKEYIVTRGRKDSRILYLSANPNGEAEVVTVYLRPRPKLKKLNFDYDFSTLAIKGKSSVGNIISRHPVRRIVKKEEGVSTLGARKIWFDDTVLRLNAEGRGVLLGEFMNDDRILTIMSSGSYKITSYDLSVHFDEDMAIIRKYDQSMVITAVYIDIPTERHYVKRFPVELTDKKVDFIGGAEQQKLVHVTLHPAPEIEILEDKKKNAEKVVVDLSGFIGLKSYKAKGKRISDHKLLEINWLNEEKPEVVPVGAEAQPGPGPEEEETVGITVPEVPAFRFETRPAEEIAAEVLQESPPGEPEAGASGSSPGETAGSEPEPIDFHLNTDEHGLLFFPGMDLSANVGGQGEETLKDKKAPKKDKKKKTDQDADDQSQMTLF